MISNVALWQVARMYLAPINATLAALGGTFCWPSSSACSQLDRRQVRRSAKLSPSDSARWTRGLDRARAGSRSGLSVAPTGCKGIAVRPEAAPISLRGGARDGRLRTACAVRSLYSLTPDFDFLQPGLYSATTFPGVCARRDGGRRYIRPTVPPCRGRNPEV